MVPNLKSPRSAQAPKKLFRSASCHGTSRNASNRPPNKKNVKCRDPKLHKLIFEEGGLLDGTKLKYCDKGETLLKGYKAGSQIFCYHCSNKVSPSEFEKHAVEESLHKNPHMKPHKKPCSYIKLENGYSLDQVSQFLRGIRSVVDNGNSRADAEKGLLCDECCSFFQKDSASLPVNTPAEGQCGFCGENSYASEAGSVAEVHPIIKTDECATCVVGKNKKTDIVCALTMCSGYKNCDCQFGPLALIDCVQCEKQFHVRCLKELGKSDLKAKPKGKWFCSLDCDSGCERIFLTLESFIGDGGEEKFKAFFTDDGRKKHMDKRSLNISKKAVRWRLLCAKSTYSDDKLLLDATSIFYENFDRKTLSVSSDDLIRDMVYGTKGQKRRMYCAVVTEGSTVVAAGLFRVLGQDFAELPLAATAKANQRKTMESYLRCFINGKPKMWASWLHWAKYWYDTSYHASTKCSPFQALYGREPPHLIRFEIGSTAVATLEEQLQERDAMLDDLKARLIKAHQRMKAQKDATRRDLEFQVGELVYLKLQPYRQQSLAIRLNDKLAPRYYWPFLVLQRVGKVAYKLELPDTAKIHNVFHISQLKKAIGATPVLATLPPQLTAELVLEGEPEMIMGVRRHSEQEGAVGEILVKWKELPEWKATWEDYNLVNHRFPAFHLEDKVEV